jgi:hypothetical protein
MLGSAVDPVTTATLPINRWRDPSIDSLLLGCRPCFSAGGRWTRDAVRVVSGVRDGHVEPAPDSGFGLTDGEQSVGGYRGFESLE